MASAHSPNSPEITHNDTFELPKEKVKSADALALFQFIRSIGGEPIRRLLSRKTVRRRTELCKSVFSRLCQVVPFGF